MSGLSVHIYSHIERHPRLTVCCRNQANYVSPSDDIMSPCSKKLSDLKGKRFKKYVPSVVLDQLIVTLGSGNGC